MNGIRFSTDTATFRNGASGNVTGQIWVELGGVAFPDADWSDFPVIVMGWWLEALHSLYAQRGDCQLHFMDGPFRVKVSVTDSGYALIEAYKNQMAVFPDAISFPIIRVAKAALGTAEEIEKFCLSSGWDNADLTTLRNNIGGLRHAISA